MNLVFSGTVVHTLIRYFKMKITQKCKIIAVVIFLEERNRINIKFVVIGRCYRLLSIDLAFLAAFHSFTVCNILQLCITVPGW